VIVSEAWSNAYPGACVGVLRIGGARNPDSDPALDAMLDQTAERLRNRWSGATRADLLAVPEMAAYAAYYRRFDKTYHVLLQLESVALKGKPLRSRGVLVAAMFRAELETGLLTAGHDAARLAGDLTLDVVTKSDRYVGIGGRDIEPVAGDMCIRDASGIVSSIVFGPDDRTRLSDATDAVVFTTYAPSAIGRDAVAAQLEVIASGVRAVSSAAIVESLEVFPLR
jgi:DNA/RNA-binding domain of Phe-tRNA-synthetase-like protein